MNGIYNIQPNIDIQAFEVECEFSDGQGVTVMKPKDWKEDGYTFPPEEDYRCEHSNCFMHNLEYDMSLDQIEVLLLIKYFAFKLYMR